MPRCVVTGSYNGHMAVACIDSTVPASWLSSRFADGHSDLSLTIKSSSGIVVECACSAPMRLPSIGGVYVSRMRINVGPLAKFDLLIGEDWITATRAIITSDGLAEPSMCDLRHLSSDHTWEPFVGGIAVGQLQKVIMPPQAILGTESILEPKRRMIPPRRNGKEPGRIPVDVPFDITHYIVSLLEPPPEPNSFAVDVVTMTRLCLVSRTFNAAANAVLYSSITISETAAWYLAATVEVNPTLLHHCHSLCFKVPTKPWLFKTWVTVAQIVYACPNLRRVAWLPGPSTKSNMWSAHLPHITDLIFPHVSPTWLGFGPTYCFPRLERLIIGNALLQDEHIMHIFLRMPQLTDLVTDPPSSSLTFVEARVEALAQGIATVVAGTALRRIIWAQLYSVIDPEKTPQRSKFEKYIPICARAHELLYAPDGRHGVTFEFVPWSLNTIRSRICDGTIWKRGDEDRARICP